MKKKVRGLVAILVAVMSLSMIAPTAVFAADSLAAPVQISENETETLLEEETTSDEALEAETETTVAYEGEEATVIAEEETSEEVRTSEAEEETTIAKEESLKEEKVVIHEGPWDGETTDTNFNGSGTQEDPYLIESASQLAGLAANVNGGEEYADKCFKLTTDIDLNNKSWTPIGTSASYYFAGSFDGDGHRISNLYISGTSNYQALFGYVRSYDSSTTASLTNFVVDGSVTNTKQYTAGVVGYGCYSLTIKNVGNEADVTCTGTSQSYTGGLAGYLETKSGAYTITVDSCYNKGDITAIYNKLGGLCGGISRANATAQFSVTNCYNTGKVTGNHSNSNYSQFGALIGYAYGAKTYPLTVSNNFNIGETYWKSGSYYAGGIFGNATATYVTPSNNYYLTDIYYYGGTAQKGCAIGSSSSTTEGYTSFAASDGLKAASLGSAFNDGNTYTVNVNGTETKVTVPVLSWEGNFWPVTFDCTNASASLGESTSVKEGNTATFTVTCEDGYFDPVVKIGGTTLEPVDGVYTIPAVYSAVTVTITTTACTHSEGSSYIEYKAPDCINTGLKKSYQCKKCGLYFSDESMANRIADIVIPANGHSFDAVGTCTVCGINTAWDGTTVKEPKLDGTTFLIGDAEELAWFRNQINTNTTYKTYNIRLTCDIFLSDKSWTPIGISTTNTWAGTLYGDGYTVHNLNADYEGATSTYCYSGLVGHYTGTLIENLNVEGAVKYAYSYSNSATGGIVGYAATASCVINNCTFKGSVSSDAYGGGIVGRGATGTTIVNCGVVGTITSSKTTSSYTGGIAGKTGPISGSQTRGAVANCYFQGTVSGALYNYGIAYGTYAIDFDNCYATSGTTCPDSATAATTGTTITNMYTSAQSAATLNNVTSDTKTAMAAKGLAYNTWYDHAAGADFTGITCAHANLTHHAYAAKTCTADGNNEYWSCDDCGLLFSDSAASTETTLEAVTIKAGHEYTSKVTKEATCADGERTYTCSACQDTYTEVIPGTGNHTYQAYDNNDGTHTYKCSVCKQAKIGGYAAGSAVTEFEAGKSYVIVTSDNYAMSSTDGMMGYCRAGVAYDSSAITDDIVWTYEEGGYLKNSGKYLYPGSSVVHLQLTDSKDNACTWQIGGNRIKITSESSYNTLSFNNTGTYIYFGRTTTGNAASAVVTVYEVTTSAATENHTYDSGSVEKAATCSEKGEMKYTCTECKAEKSEDIPATGNHNFVDGFCTVCNGLDPDAETYLVKNAAQLLKVSESAAEGNNFAGKTVKLAGNISLSDTANWNPIGGNATQYELTLASQADLDAALEEHFVIYDNTGASYVRGSEKNGKYDSARTYYYQTGSTFDGTFDGCGYAVTDLTVNTDKGYAGFFGAVKGTVKNLTVSGTVTSTTTQDYVGGIAGKLEAGGTIEKCVSNVDVTANSAFNIGGIVGSIGELGKFVSDDYPMATVSECVNNGNVSGKTRVGGIAGKSAGTIKNCANHGTIFNYSGRKHGIGGIVGMNGVNNTAVDAGIVTGCYNDGFIDSNNGFWAGGIVGFQNSKSVTQFSYNAGLLKTAMNKTDDKLSWVNPIVGQSEGKVISCLWINEATGDNTADYVGKDATGVGSNGGSVTDVKGVTKEELKAVSSVNALNTNEVTNFQADCNNFPALMFETATAHNAVTDEAVEATCTKTGLTEGSHCSVCESIIVAQEVVPLKDHTVVTDKAVAATCEHTGLTEGSHCSACGKVLVEQKIVEKLQHNLKLTGYVKSTCTVNGYSGDYVCTLCNKVITSGKALPLADHENVVDKGYPATYSKEGLTDGTHCSVCGTVTKKQEVIPKLIPDGWNLISGNYYYYKNNKMIKGWIEDNGQKYYTNLETGIRIEGLVKVDGKWFYFNPKGSGEMLTGLQKINGYWRYFDPETGKMLTGLQTINGYIRCFEAGNGRMVTGLNKVDGSWYYFEGSTGRALTGLQKINGYWRFFDLNSAKMLTGLQKVNGYWRYFEKDTGRMLTGLQKDGGFWYYFEAENGRMVTGLTNVNTYWRYFQPSNGRMVTGFLKIKNNWYYFEPDTGRAYTGTHTINGKTYKFDKNGVMIK